MNLADIWKWLLALLGIGGVVMLATGAWAVPATGIYAELLPHQYDWAHNGSSQQCVWEVHPNTSKTINSVSFKVLNSTGYVIGDASTWVAGTQDANDLLIWRTANFTTNPSGMTYNCSVRVVQNEFPGTSEYLANRSFTTIGLGIPGCLGAPDCVISTPTTLNKTAPYLHRSIKVTGTTLTLDNNITLIGTWNISTEASGAITFTSGDYPNPINYNWVNFTTLLFSNAGTLSANGNNACRTGINCARVGGPGHTLYFSAREIKNSGTIQIDGGDAAAWASGSELANRGGPGGNITIYGHANFSNTGTISGRGGDGVAGAMSNCAGGPISNAGMAGQNGGAIVNGSALNFSSSGLIDFRGGTGGDGSICYPGSPWLGCMAGYNGGNGTTTTLNISNNITVTNNIYATGGAGGADVGCGGGSAGNNGIFNVTYCNNGTGNDWTKFSPTSTQTFAACVYPTTPTFVTPIASSNYIANLQNMTVNVTPPGLKYVFEISADNGSTWTPYNGSLYSIFSVSTNNSPIVDTHRMSSQIKNTSIVRAYTYNSTTDMFSAWVNSANFNLSPAAASTIGTSSPSGVVSTPTIRFYCNYSNSSGSEIEAATAYLMLDNVAYAMTPNATSKTYYWDNTVALTAGEHFWQCSISKANYNTSLSTNTSLNLTGFGVSLPTGQTSVRLTCPFPTIAGMTPAGQKAGIGIFRITNYNATGVRNYTMYLNNTLPTGVTVYGRCDRFSPNIAGWTALSTTTGYLGIINLVYTNTSAYCWLRMDCVNAVPGAYAPVGYVFAED
jgi:hypothetical protein